MNNPSGYKTLSEAKLFISTLLYVLATDITILDQGQYDFMLFFTPRNGVPIWESRHLANSPGPGPISLRHHKFQSIQL